MTAPATAPQLVPCPECYSRRPSPSLQARGRGSKHDRHHQTAVTRQPRGPVQTGYPRRELAAHLMSVHGWSGKRAIAAVPPGEPRRRESSLFAGRPERTPKLTPAQRRRRLRRMWRAVRPAWWKARAAEVVSIEPPAVAA